MEPKSARGRFRASVGPPRCLGLVSHASRPSQSRLSRRPSWPPLPGQGDTVRNSPPPGASPGRPVVGATPAASAALGCRTGRVVRPPPHLSPALALFPVRLVKGDHSFVLLLPQGHRGLGAPAIIADRHSMSVLVRIWWPVSSPQGLLPMGTGGRGGGRKGRGAVPRAQRGSSSRSTPPIPEEDSCPPPAPPKGSVCLRRALT